MSEKLPLGIDTGQTEMHSAKTVVELGSQSGVKVRPVQEALKRVFGSSELITKEVNLATKPNPYGAETVFAGVTRMVTLPEVAPTTQADWMQAVIESGVFATDHFPIDRMSMLQIPGKLSPDRYNPDGTFTFPEGTVVIPVMAGEEGQPLDLEDTVFNVHDTSIAPDAVVQPGAQLDAAHSRVTMPDGQEVSYPDRAVAIFYDPQTDTTVLGVSRGVLFPPEYVNVAIGEQHGNVRVAEEWRKGLIDSGELSPEGYVVRDGVVTSELFDKQDPQAYGTKGHLPRAMQIREIVDVVMDQLKKVRG